MGVLFVRRAIGNVALELDQGGLVRLGLATLYRLLDGFNIRAVPVHHDHVPVVGFKALGHVFGERQAGVTINGDTVVVVHHHEIVQAQMSGQGCGFRRHALLKISVPADGIDVVVEHRKAIPVELAGQILLSNGHAHAIGEPLSQRSGRDFDTQVQVEFRMARGLAVQLTKILEILKSPVIATQMQHGIEQHAAMTTAQDKPVAVDPSGICRIVLHDILVQHIRSGRHADGHARVSGLCLLYAFCCQKTNRVNTQSIQFRSTHL